MGQLVGASHNSPPSQSPCTPTCHRGTSNAHGSRGDAGAGRGRKSYARQCGAHCKQPPRPQRRHGGAALFGGVMVSGFLHVSWSPGGHRARCGTGDWPMWAPVCCMMHACDGDGASLVAVPHTGDVPTRHTIDLRKARARPKGPGSLPAARSPQWGVCYVHAMGATVHWSGAGGGRWTTFARPHGSGCAAASSLLGHWPAPLTQSLACAPRFCTASVPHSHDEAHVSGSHLVPAGVGLSG
jgi:hypothetical protein